MQFSRPVAHRGGKVLAVSAGIAAAIAAVFLGSPAALAAGTSPAQHVMPVTNRLAVRSYVIPIGAHSVSASVGGTRVSIVPAKTAAPATTNTCTLTVDTPFRYYGGPYGGGEEAIADITCTLPVQELDIAVGLYRGGVLVASNTNTNYSNYFINVNVDYPVSAGNYQTGGLGDVYWGDGTVSELGEDYSDSVYLS